MAGKQTVGEALKLANKRVLVKDAVALIGDLRKTVKAPKQAVKRAAVNSKKAALLNSVKTVVSMHKMAKEAHDAAKKELTRVAVQYTMAKHSSDANFKKKAAVELARALTFEKAASITGRVGAGMLSAGGGALRALGRALRGVGMGQAGALVRRKGVSLGQTGTAASKLLNRAKMIGPVTPEMAQILERAAKSPALGQAQLTGMGGLGAGAYGLLSMLGGGAAPEKAAPELALPPHYAEEYPQ